MPDFDLVAHRGYPDRYPDNSMAGIRAALDAGARQLEIDVQLSSDGTPWLFHDETLSRVCGLGGRLVDLSDEGIGALRASEAPRFGARFQDEPIARLADVARELEGRPEVFTFVEIKPVAVETHGAETVVDAVAACLGSLEGRVAIISFSVECLRVAAERTPYELGLILESWSQLATDFSELRTQHVFCDVDKLPAEGLLEVDAVLTVYEVVDPELARQLVARGARNVETFAYPQMRAALGAASE
jgi:glycerophosphoryl diester phosphodiesterase